MHGKVRRLGSLLMSSKRGDSTTDNPSLGVGFYCDEARSLLDEFGRAVQQVVMLNEQQFQAIVAGDDDASRFDLLIHEANETKQNMKFTSVTCKRTAAQQ